MAIRPVFCRAVCLLLAAALAASFTLPAAAAGETYVYSLPVKMSGTVVNGSSTAEVNTALELDYHWFTDGNPHTFHRNLAELAVLLSADAYDAGAVTANLTGTPNRQDNLALPIALGLTEVEQIEVGAGADGIDSDDTARFIAGHRAVTDGAVSYEVYIVSIQGTDNSKAEWQSNFDLGSESDSYVSRTGEHPDWINHLHHKGFDVSANRVMRALSDYLAKAEETDGASRVFFVTGHSRGGAIANILGRMLTDSGETAFTYTLAAPRTTLVDQDSARSYDTVFNIINGDDLVPYLPMAEWGYTRYGTDLEVSISCDAAARSDASAYLNTAYGGQDMTALAALFSAISPEGRDKLYDTDKASSRTFVLASAAERDEEAAYLRQVLAKIGGDGYCTVSLPGTAGNKYPLAVEFCPALLLRGIAALMASSGQQSGGDILMGLGTIMPDQSYGTLVSALVNTAWSNPDAIAHPHYAASYLAAAKSLPEKAAPEGSEASLIFSDVSAERWSAPYVTYVSENGLMSGTGDGLFSPDRVLTRGMLMTILARMDGADTANGEPWYLPGMEWAKENRISDGSNPENPVTREQMMAMLYRYAQKQGQGFTGSWLFLLAFIDRGDISEWADEAAHWCVMKSIVEGTADGRLNPGGFCTREQAAAMLMRFCQVV